MAPSLGIIFLGLAVAATSAFTLIMRWSQARGYSVLAVGGVNYLAAALTAACFISPGQLRTVSPNLWVIAGLSGVGFVLTYLLLTPALRRHGVAVPTAAVNVAMVVPVLVAACCWHERLAPAQAVGVILALAAVFLLAPAADRSASLPGGTFLLIPAIFALSGATRVTQKLLTLLAPTAQQPVLSAIWFGAAAAFALGLLTATGWPTRRGEWLAGLCLGWVNLASLACLMRALALLPSVVVFPVTSCLSLLLVSLAGLVFWREHPTPRAALGLLTCLVAVALVGSH